MPPFISYYPTVPFSDSTQGQRKSLNQTATPALCYRSLLLSTKSLVYIRQTPVQLPEVLLSWQKSNNERATWQWAFICCFKVLISFTASFVILFCLSKCVMVFENFWFCIIFFLPSACPTICPSITSEVPLWCVATAKRKMGSFRKIQYGCL